MSKNQTMPLQQILLHVCVLM